MRTVDDLEKYSINVSSKSSNALFLLVFKENQKETQEYFWILVLLIEIW